MSMHVYVICMCLCVPVSVCECSCPGATECMWRSKYFECWCLLSMLLDRVSCYRALTLPGQLAYTPLGILLSTPPISPYLFWDYKYYHSVLFFFYLSSRDRNPVPHIHVVSTLPTEPYPQFQTSARLLYHYPSICQIDLVILIKVGKQFFSKTFCVFLTYSFCSLKTVYFTSSPYFSNIFHNQSDSSLL